MKKQKLLGITISNDDYHKDITRVSKSGLDLINRSPAHYFQRYLDPLRKIEDEPEKEWQIVGSATGTAILEPDEFKRYYAWLDDLEICKEIGGPRPTTTNKYKEWIAEETKKLQGKKIISLEDYNRSLAMRDAVHKHPAAKALLKSGQAERTFYFIDPLTGAACRIRPDFLSGTGFTVDVKTTEDARPEAFARSCYKFRYHVQDSYYTDGLKHNGIDRKGFIFIVVEKKPPHNVAVYTLSDPSKVLGRTEYQSNLFTYKECQDKGIWPGYGDLVLPLDLPQWAFNKPNHKD